MKTSLLLLITALCIGSCKDTQAQKETPKGPPGPASKNVLRLMSYNVLRYGDGCQGSNSTMHSYLKTIVTYTDPDILGLVKVEAIPQADGEKGKAPIGFADSILRYAVNSAFPGRYAYCPFTNAAKDNDQCVLFYNKAKLGLAGYNTLVSRSSDFNMYRLYYRDTRLANSHDTNFLYIVLIHTSSGDKNEERDAELAKLAKEIRKSFTLLPNLVVMGDFNLRKTNEPGYQALVNNDDAKYSLLDPPFGIDKTLSYPANWDKHPEDFAAWLTTSTRLDKSQPNDCGTGGGAKFWYDHMLMAPSLARAGNYYSYVAHSYHTVGNDGKRVEASVNTLPNTSAPPAVLEALYQMSNKYPVMAEIAVNSR